LNEEEILRKQIELQQEQLNLIQLQKKLDGGKND